MTVTITPLTDAQKEKLRKIKQTFESITYCTSKLGSKAPSNLRVRFQNAIKRLETFVNKEKLTLVRIADSGDYKVTDPAFYPWRLDRIDPPRGYLWWEDVGHGYVRILSNSIKCEGACLLVSIQRS